MTVLELKKQFVDIYGRGDGELRVFRAPGRVNLIGDHTDYNGGFVFPAALSLSTTVVARPRRDRRIRLIALDLRQQVDAQLDELDAYSRGEWGAYQLGVAYTLLQAGFQLTGCDLLYYDTVPFGAGLSSSAAVEVATAYALVTLGNEAVGNSDKVDLIKLAQLCQRAENDYIGVNCGIMDQFASAKGKRGHAMLLRCHDLKYVDVPLRLDGYKLVISNTNKQRSLSGSRYNERRKECQLGLQILQRSLPKASCLGEVTLEQYKQYGSTIKFINIKKRVAHVISEDDRVLRSAKALGCGDLVGFGRLMTESHRSLKELYEVSCAELDVLVEEALKIDGVLGSRMTGAGFGGCTVSIVEETAVQQFISQVGGRYHQQTGLGASFYIPEIGDGVREITAGE